MLAVAIFVLEGYAPLGMVCKGERERVVRRLAGHAAAAVGVESSTRASPPCRFRSDGSVIQTIPFSWRRLHATDPDLYEYVSYRTLL